MAHTPMSPNLQPLNDPALTIPMGVFGRLSHINKFGALDPVPVDTPTDIWDGGGLYPFPTSAVITNVSQTADQVANRGALVEVQGLDADWNQVIQTVALDAADTTTAVALGTPLLRCFRMILKGDTPCDSTIRAHNAAESVDYAIISVGANQTLMAVYTVPANKTAFMTSYFVSNIDTATRTPKSTEILLQAITNTDSSIRTVKHANAIPEAGPPLQHFFNPYYRFQEKTDIVINVECAFADGHVHAGFDIILWDSPE